MTNSEIIEQLDSIVGTYEILVGNGVNSDILEIDDIDAIREAIKALNAEPCEDCISRDTVLDLVADYDLSMGQVVKGIHALPPVTPAEKVGHWEQYGNSWENKFKCSECGKEQPKILCCERIIGHWSDFCPNCGAKMV